jgi:membrane-bound serine protease (ClpP class)
MNETLWILFIYITGLLAMIIELFLPGAIIGITGFLAVCGSILFAFTSGHPTLATILIITTLLYIPCFFLLWKQVIGNIFALKSSEETFRPTMNRYEGLLGKKGEATSPLRPSGTAAIDGKRYAVITRGEMLEKGQAIEVIDVAGSRITVRAVSNDEVDRHR